MGISFDASESLYDCVNFELEIKIRLCIFKKSFPVALQEGNIRVISNLRSLAINRFSRIGLDRVARLYICSFNVGAVLFELVE
jgi:hypothetical protein